MTRIVILLMTLGLVAGCNAQDRLNYQEFDGIYFPTTSKSQRQQKNVFTVRVRNATRSLDGARQAAHYEGTKYCVSTFGSSDIAWETDLQAEELTLSGNDLIAAGTCLE